MVLRHLGAGEVSQWPLTGAQANVDRDNQLHSLSSYLPTYTVA